jgi:sensor histidine kinase YesM
MSQRINLLLAEIKESERNKRKLEFQALQAQVNPHMIYNTLNTITYLAQLQNVTNIYEVSSSFAGLLHLISNSEGEYITIEAEMEYIQAYIAIKKYNMICNMQIEYQIDPRAKNCYILKLLLQPIIENAIVHGFSTRTVDALLTIRIINQDSRILIDIIDNGSGIDETAVAQILSGKKKSKNNFTSIGIHNTIQRLQLQYGENSLFHIISYPDIGTTVHIEFPIVEKV